MPIVAIFGGAIIMTSIAQGALLAAQAAEHISPIAKQSQLPQQARAAVRAAIR